MREGPTRRPYAHRWPLDGVLVGVGTLRVLRELFCPHIGPIGTPVRAWDVSLWCGVTPAGVTRAFERLEGASIIELARPATRERAATYRLRSDHPLYRRFGELFTTERATAPRTPRRPVAGQSPVS